MSAKWTIQIMRISVQLRLILMDMGHRLMTYSMQLILKMISNMLHCGSPSMLKYKSEGSSNWIVHKVQYLLRFFKWGSKLSGLDCGENSTVKRS
jgi:hypothetical protein